MATLAFNGVVALLLALVPGRPAPQLELLDKATRCLCLLAAVDIVKSLTARMLSLRVHSGALVDEVWVRAGACVTPWVASGHVWGRFP